MLPDAEVVKVISEILEELELGNFTIKLNNRKILDAMMSNSDKSKKEGEHIMSNYKK